MRSGWRVLAVASFAHLAACHGNEAATREAGAGRQSAQAANAQSSAAQPQADCSAGTSPSLSDWTPFTIVLDSLYGGGPPFPSRLNFPTGDCWQTRLWDVRYVGLLPAVHRPPYFVLLAHRCVDCDDPYLRLWVGSPLYGSSIGDNPLPAPGVWREAESDSVVEETHAFLGRCLSDSTEVLLVFDSSNEYATVRRSVWVVEVRGDSLSKRLIADDIEAFRPRPERLSGGGCRELPGVDQRAQPPEGEG